MKYEIYQVTRGKHFIGQWRFRIRAGNGRIIAHSGESYINYADALAAIDLIKNSQSAPVVTVER